MLRYLLIIRRILADTIGHFNLADGWAMASHVALSGLLALFPFLIFATTLATFLGAEQFSENAVHLVFDTWPETIAAPIAREVQNVLTVQRGDLLTMSALLAAFFASNGVEALRVALNRAYRVSEQRSVVILRLQSLGFVIIATLSMMAISFLLILAPLVFAITRQYVPGLDAFATSIAFWRYLIALLVLIIGLFVVHMWLPAGRRSVASLAPGIIITIVAWLIGATLFASYLESFATYVSTYAGLASIMIALVFLYILSAIFIFGAELNAALHRYMRTRQGIKAA